MTRTAFLRTVVTVPAGGSSDWDDVTEHAWDDVLVMVRSGEVEVLTRSGSTSRFASGATLCLAGIGLRRLSAVGDVAVVLVGVRRRPAG